MKTKEESKREFAIAMSHCRDTVLGTLKNSQHPIDLVGMMSKSITKELEQLDKDTIVSALAELMMHEFKETVKERFGYMIDPKEVCNCPACSQQPQRN